MSSSILYSAWGMNTVDSEEKHKQQSHYYRTSSKATYSEFLHIGKATLFI